MCFFRGTVLANKVGRRWTHSSLLGINALLFGAVMVMVPYQVWCESWWFQLIYFFIRSTLTLASPRWSKCFAWLSRWTSRPPSLSLTCRQLNHLPLFLPKKTYICHICCSCLLPWVRCASGNVFYYKRISTQAMEIFPTPVRQSGIGFITFISQVRLWD